MNICSPGSSAGSTNHNADEDCRREAHRRDNLAKQHRYQQRRRARGAQVKQAISAYVATNGAT
jgi:hypothetical protein